MDFGIVVHGFWTGRVSRILVEVRRPRRLYPWGEVASVAEPAPVVSVESAAEVEAASTSKGLGGVDDHLAVAVPVTPDNSA